MENRKFKLVKKVEDISEYQLKSNGLRVIYKYIPDTEVVTSNIVYLVGSRDESYGETGLAHMLEHMLFKPTKKDKSKRLKDSEAMLFDKETGSISNANTWLDRTSYFYSFPKEYFARAMALEAERMVNLVLTDKEFLPERANVLSEFDMYNGMPEFALSVAMQGTAFLAHPYKHETIGFRGDIENYTVEKLQKFYQRFYCPNNATLIVVGDITLKEIFSEVEKNFGKIAQNKNLEKERLQITEPKQEGLRRVLVEREGVSNIISLGVKHAGFPNSDWYAALVALKLLAEGQDSLLSRALVDSGLATKVDFSINPARDISLASVDIKLADGNKLAEVEEKALNLIRNVTETWLKKQLKPVLARTISSEIFGRDSSLDIAQDLVEGVAAQDWTTYFSTEKTLKSLTEKKIKKTIEELFTESQMTIGVYKSF